MYNKTIDKCVVSVFSETYYYYYDSYYYFLETNNTIIKPHDNFPLFLKITDGTI